MTAYFDDCARQIHEASVKLRLPSENFAALEALRLIEEKMVFDVTVAAMLPGFPADCREMIHKVVLKHGVHTRPVNAPEADYEDDSQYVSRMRELEGGLHSVFHEVAHALGGGWDNPLVGIRRIYAQGDAEREKMVVPAVHWHLREADTYCREAGPGEAESPIYDRITGEPRPKGPQTAVQREVTCETCQLDLIRITRRTNLAAAQATKVDGE